jgi:cyclophilin family peptidyl-prolyl cis-trans isomerase
VGWNKEYKASPFERLSIGCGCLVPVVVGVVALAFGAFGPKQQRDSGFKAAFVLDSPTACPPSDGYRGPHVDFFRGAAPMCIDVAKKITAKISTTAATFTVTLDATKAPKTTNNFVVLARYRLYDNHDCSYRGDALACGPTLSSEVVDELRTEAASPDSVGEYEIGWLAMANKEDDKPGTQFFLVIGESAAKLKPTYSLFARLDPGQGRALKAVADAKASSVPIRIVKVQITEV